MTEPEKFGTYMVYELLGKGGMATVHRAESQSAGGFRKRVALKRLLPHLLAEPEVVESFSREAKLASHLRHANIAQTYDLGIRDGTYFIAMELVPGPTLRQIVRQCEDAAGAMPIEHVLEILVQVCEALDYAHNLVDDNGRPLGIVHRDVTPANIIVSGSGTVKLIDFGLAKVASSRGTKTGILKGKLGYMAPEYTLGQLDHRADLFAVGVIAHELLTGKRLFDNPNDFEIITMLREMPIQPPSRWNAQVGLALDDIVMTALSRDPGLRWQSAAAMRAALVNVGGELKLLPSRDGLAKWVEWAFTRQPRRDVSGLSQVIDTLGDPSDQRAITIEPEMLLTPTPTPVSRQANQSPRGAPVSRQANQSPRGAPAPVGQTSEYVRGRADTPTVPRTDSTPATTVAPVNLGVPRNSGVFETEGVIVGRSILPEAHRARIWPWLLLLLFLAAAGGGAYWYLLLRK